MITQIHALEQEVNQQKVENQVPRNDVDDLKRRLWAVESENGNHGIPVLRKMWLRQHMGKLLFSFPGIDLLKARCLLDGENTLVLA